MSRAQTETRRAAFLIRDAPNSAGSMLNSDTAATTCALLIFALFTNAAAQPSTGGPGVYPLHAADGHFPAGLVSGDVIEVEMSSIVLFGMIGTWAGVLVDDTEIGGIHCAAGASVSFEYGTLVGCSLASSFESEHGTIPRLSYVELNDRTSVRYDLSQFVDASFVFFAVTLSETTEWGGVRYEAGVELILNPDGTVWMQHLREVTDAPNTPVPCRHGTEQDRALLYPDGTLARCALLESFNIDGVLVPQHSVVWLDESGDLTRVDLHEDWILGDATYHAGTFVAFDNGQPRHNESRFIVTEANDTRRQSWRVESGLFYGYPWIDVPPER